MSFGTVHLVIVAKLLQLSLAFVVQVYLSLGEVVSKLRVERIIFLSFIQSQRGCVDFLEALVNQQPFGKTQPVLLFYQV